MTKKELKTFYKLMAQYKKERKLLKLISGERKSDTNLCLYTPNRKKELSKDGKKPLSLNSTQNYIN